MSMSFDADRVRHQIGVGMQRVVLRGDDPELAPSQIGGLRARARDIGEDRADPRRDDVRPVVLRARARHVDLVRAAEATRRRWGCVRQRFSTTVLRKRACDTGERCAILAR
jgi:hypothetical protein